MIYQLGQIPMNRCLIIAALVSSVLGASAAASEADQTRQASTFVAGLIETSSSMSADGARPFMAHYDLAGAMPTVLGRYWDKATVEQRARCLRVFREFLMAGYASTFGRVASRLRVADAWIEGDRMVVRSIDGGERDAPSRVDWVVTHRDGQLWRISDVRVGGVSIIEIVRQQFATLLRDNHGDIEALLAVVQRQTDLLNKAPR